MSYQHIEGLNPAKCLTDYHCARMLDTDNNQVVRRINCRRVKEAIETHEVFIEELEGQGEEVPAFVLDLKADVLADLTKWRKALAVYRATLPKALFSA